MAQKSITFSHLLDYVQGPPPQLGLNETTNAIVPLCDLIYAGDETQNKHSGYGGFKC
jgi:hypothetical protein